jgi:predicted MFS family arabinose efflux permease
VMMSLGSAVGNFIGGALLERFSTAQMYGIMGASVLIGMVFFLLLGGVKSSHQG